MEPLQMKEVLTKVHHEIVGIQERMESVRMNGGIIMEKSRSDKEKELVQTTIDQLTQQLGQIRGWIDDKKQQVGDSLDAWTRFMNLYQIVMSWASEKRAFVAEPMKITTLYEARQKLNDYSNAVKSIKPIVKNLSEMDKELDSITQVTTVGDLRNKLIEAEESKVEVEAILLERNGLLQETAEEWEQCEKKLKDVRTWIDKTKTVLDSPQHKKKPLRDQLGLCEKYIADSSIQKTKIQMSIEKLQVHFRAGIGGDTKICETATGIVQDLDELSDLVKAKNNSLERTLAQLDTYQQQIQSLRQKILLEEQQLRLVLAPTYLPHDREKAVTEQQACRERVKHLQAKINARNERIKLLIQRGSPDDDPLDT